MTRRYRERAPETSADRWVVSYADFITLLLAFFVVMYSISSVNEGKYQVLSESLSGIFLGVDQSFEQIAVGDLSLRNPNRDIGLLEQQPMQEPGRIEGGEQQGQELLQIQSDAKARFQELIADGEISVSANKLWLEIEIGSGVLFESGRAAPNQNADALLEGLATILKPYNNPLQVEGFTDNQPIQSDRYPSNWELSAARAAGVVRILAYFGVDSKRMAAIGYGENRPKVSNRSARGRSKNRRIVIIVARDETVQRALANDQSHYFSDDAAQKTLQQQPIGPAPAIDDAVLLNQQ
ncbi:MAG: flagellar motor protein MotD [Motiliproteus sp.]